VSVHSTKLKVRATGEFVDANLHDDLGLESLFDAEADWAPMRIRLVQRFLSRGIGRQEWPQSLHWNWAEKAIHLQNILGNALGSERLVGIECGGKWQGLLLGECTGHRSRTSAPPKELVYVEFVESAPWNWEMGAIGQEPLYRGVGPQLLEMATRWSEHSDSRDDSASTPFLSRRASIEADVR
jgi:hypothetical protein